MTICVCCRTQLENCKENKTELGIVFHVILILRQNHSDNVNRPVSKHTLDIILLFNVYLCNYHYPEIQSDLFRLKWK